MKKFIILLMATLMLLTLVACGGGNTDDTSVDTSSDSSQKPSTNSCNHELEEEWRQTIPPKCTSKGVEVRACKKCDYKASRYVDPIGHTEVVLEAVPPTCTQDGLTEGKKCSVCNKVLEEQKFISRETAHEFTEFIKTVTAPTIGGKGKANFKCANCDKTKEIELDALKSELITKNDVFSIETTDYNPAVDNKWKILDGNKGTAGIYSTGDDWFGNKGDTLTITLDQERILTSLDMYVAGNWTFAEVTVRNAKGQVTASKKNIKADGAAYGAKEGVKVNIYSGSKGTKAYTIEIKITEIKENYLTFKVSELEIMAAKVDTRLPHDHVYREYVKETVKATCLVKGKASYACFCGKETEKDTGFGDHEFTHLQSSTPVTCTTDGKAIYKCDCGNLKQFVTKAKGHIYAKLLNYVKEPTMSANGEAVFKCIGCELTSNKTMQALPIEKINYLRVDSIKNGKVTLKLNIYSDAPSFEIRYSSNEITESNFKNATKIDAEITGKREITLTLNLDASLEKCYYVAVKPYSGENSGKIATVRVGGNKLIPIDYNSANIYHGEVLDSFVKLFDEQSEEYRNGVKTPSTVLSKIFKDENDKILYGSNLSPIVDLEYMHYVSSVFLYYAEAGKNVKVRWSSTPVDFMASDSLWDGCYELKSQTGWNEIKLNADTRYIQIIFKDAEAPYEMMVYGFQNGDGDTIATSINKLPTIGDMIGMCGFVAAGGGYTPISSVSCTTVLREYHNFGWTYSLSNYSLDKYLNKPTFFSNSWMGNFDSEYASFRMARINVIPCIQWNLKENPLSYKVDENNLPKTSDGSFIKGDFWDKFNPHTYFTYADGMFTYAARYGSNKASSLIDIMLKRASDNMNVGLGYIDWIELGNEPDGSWNGIHNYYSAYQLAALTSAAYDGHGRTMVSSIDGIGYHFGVKNADSNMGAAMAGVSAASREYITALCYWMKANRNDGKIAFDAFNVHNYMTKEIILPNGMTCYVGASPEESDIVGALSKIVELRNKYYPEKEVWITEFGWDTNQSYATTTSAHAYGEYTGRQVQAMWLTRTYLLLSAIGIDKATMYMCEDVGAVENEAVGKYATTGVIGFEYDENGNKIEVKKDSYYYLYTLKNTLGSYTFDSKVEAYDENVLIYKYTTENGKTAYALWCKTSDGTKSEGYQLRIDASGAMLVEAEYGSISGRKTELKADDLGYVTVNVSENPIYVVVD